MKTDQKQKSITWILFIVYLAALIWIILFKFGFSISELAHSRSLNLIPFGDSMIVNGQVDISEIIMNAVIFLPFGIYICMVFPQGKLWLKILTAVSLSILLEAIQYILAIGRSDITDVIENSLGGILGILIYALLRAAFKTEARAHRFILICAAAATAAMVLLLGILAASNL